MTTTDLEKQGLIAALRKSSTELRNVECADRADATGARHLQEKTSELLLKCQSAPARLHSYWLSTLIDDVFYNLFGDTPYTQGTEQARRQICSDLSSLFGSLADSLEQNDPTSQVASWERFVNAYLQLIEAANQKWKRGEEP